MAKAIDATTMNKTYGTREYAFAPAAAFDVIDLDPAMRTDRDSVTATAKRLRRNASGLRR